MAKKARRQRTLPFRIVAFVFAIVFLLAGAREGIAGYVCAKHSDHGEHANSRSEGPLKHRGAIRRIFPSTFEGNIRCAPISTWFRARSTS